MSWREPKEAFSVSDLVGTSVGEVALVTSMAPLGLLLRGLLLLLCDPRTAPQAAPPSPWRIRTLLLDFCVTVLPLVLSYTVLSNALLQAIALPALVSACLSLYVYRSGSGTARLPNTVGRLRKTAKKTFLHSRVQSQSRVPLVTSFRAFVSVKTAISILAVDFHAFPRRFAKTETYGTSLMDVGLGAYVLANALVSPEARRRRREDQAPLRKQLLSVWPLLALGLGRLASVKMAGYHENLTEYGLHWNSFFTLAAVRVLASALFTVFPVDKSWLVAVFLCVSYQFALETSCLKSFIVDDDGGERTRGFLHANREGVFSVAGYLAIYMAGVQIGLHATRPRARAKDRLTVTAGLLLASGALYCALYACQTAVEPASRRTANAPFCVWTVAQCLWSMSCLGAADTALLYLRSVAAGHGGVPSSSWNPRDDKDDSRRSEAEEGPGLLQAEEGPGLLQAVNRNQLLFFMLANVMTGLINVTIDTFSVGRCLSVCLLSSYMFALCWAMHALHVCGITVKFW